MQKTKLVVNSWNEWDALEEVVVGCADHACFEPTELGCRPQIRGAKSVKHAPFPGGPEKP